jgi:hypothetical protein
MFDLFIINNLLFETGLANKSTMSDIFDCWFFMEKRTPINKDIVESRMKMPLAEYLQQCIDLLESISDKGLMQGLGELMENSIKKFVQTKMRSETISLLKFYKEFPIL